MKTKILLFLTILLLISACEKEEKELDLKHFIGDWRGTEIVSYGTSDTRINYALTIDGNYKVTNFIKFNSTSDNIVYTITDSQLSDRRITVDYSWSITFQGTTYNYSYSQYVELINETTIKLTSTDPQIDPNDFYALLYKN